MSVTGTGIAASVAQTGLQAQQVSRHRDRQAQQTAADAKRMRDLLEQHMRALEEGEQPETAAQLHIDGQLPQHQSSGQQPRHNAHLQHSEAAPGEEESQPQASSAEAPKPDSPLYRHLDVQA